MTYAVNDIINTAAIIYRCLIAHTSGTFATDLAANKWEIDTNKWATSTAYLLGTFVYQNSLFYYCQQNHTSSTSFATDLAAGDWIQQSIFEVPTPYSETDIASIRVAQSADVLFMVHPDYAPRELTRYHDTVWDITTYDFLNGPLQLANDDTTWTMRVLATSGNTTITSSANFFFPTHVGGVMQLVHQIEGQSIAQAFTSSTQSASVLCGGTWRIISHGTWTGKFKVEKSTDSGATWTTLRQFSSTNDFNVDTYGNEDMSNGALPFLVRINMNAYTSGTCNVDLTTDPFQSKGCAKLNTYISPTQMSVTMQRATGSTATTTNWAEGAWSDYRGWPQAICFAQDRLIFAGNYNSPQTIWMTQTSNYYDFYVNNPLTDADSISINLPSQKLNAINGLTPLLRLLAFSSGAEWTIGAEGSGLLSPTTISTRVNSNTGSSGVQPVVILNRAVYVQARGCVVRDLGYDLFTDTFNGSNLSVLANHLLFNYNIVEMAYQQDPDSIVWAVRDDGILLSMTYLREQEVLGWCWHDTYYGDDLFESVCSIPAVGYNQVWFVVNRGGQRYIERMAQRVASDVRADQYFVDCGVTQDNTTTPDSYVKLLMHCDASPFTDEKGNSITNTSAYDSYTKLMLHCDGADGATTFTDETGKTVTNTGNYDSYTKLMLHLDNNLTDSALGATCTGTDITYSTTAGQYKWGYSAVFNGTTSQISVPHSINWAFGNGDFTMEAWINITDSNSGQSQNVFHQGNTAGDRSFDFKYRGDTGNLMHFAYYTNGSDANDIYFSWTPTYQTLYHIALVRSGASLKFYVNGVQTGATGNMGTDTLTDSAAALYIGSNSAGQYFHGYIDEYRISKGIARWTANFTPPPHPYGQVYIDTSTKVFGTGAGYVDGSGSYLSLATSSDFYFNGDFTIDFRINTNQFLTGNQTIIAQSDGTNYWQLLIDANGANIYLLSTGAHQYITATLGMTAGTWYHFAVVRSGNNFYFFKNGTQLGSTSVDATAMPNITGSLTIGSLYYSGVYGNFSNYYIDELRISKGIARWTANFTPPTSAYGNASCDTSTYKFGGGSVFMDGLTNYLSVTDSTDWTFGAGDFTVEGWFNFNDLTGQQYFLGQYADINNRSYFYKDSGNKLGFFSRDSSNTRAAYTTTNAVSLLTSAWYHLAFVRNGTNFYIFVNGVHQVLTATTPISTNTLGDIASALVLGARADGTTGFFNGWMDEIRVSKGIARWTSDFTSPTAPYTIYGGLFTYVTVAHLNGRVVACLADGNVQLQQTVSGSTITLLNPSTLAHCGLPYYSDLETLNVEVGLPDGTLQGRKVHIPRVVLRMNNSRGGFIGANFDNLFELLGDYKTSVDTSLYTGDLKIPLGGGYEDGGRFCYRQVDPLPVEILAVMPHVVPGGTTGL